VRKQEEQQLLIGYRQMDPVHQRVFVALVELLARDGVAGWLTVRTAIDYALQTTTTKKGKRVHV
jgi:hypothetical protein